MAYIGNTPAEKYISITSQTFTTIAGTGYTLSSSVTNSEDIALFLNNVRQKPSTYTASGTTLTKGTTTTVADELYCIYLGKGIQTTTPASGSVNTAQLVDGAVTGAKVNSTFDISTKTTTLPASVSGLGTGITNAQLAGSIANAKLVNDSITINGTAVALGGTISNVGEEDFPTVTSISPSVITNAQTTITITGTNFVSIPIVEAINTAGAITTADSVTYTSATSVDAAFTLPVDGTYYIRVENVTTGLAGRSSSALLTVSDAPEWVTSAGTLGTFSGSVAISTITLTCTDATSFAVTSGAVTTGLTFTTGVGSATITGTQTAHTSAATDSFTVTATDAEGQTSARAFSITWSFTIEGSRGFN